MRNTVFKNISFNIYVRNWNSGYIIKEMKKCYLIIDALIIIIGRR